jgi:hypothetical protein
MSNFSLNLFFPMVYWNVYSFYIFLSLAIDLTQEPLKSKIIKGIELTVNNRFSEAFDLYEGMIQDYPDHPVGYFYAGACLQAKMLDAENYEEADKFYALMDRTLRIADSLKSVNEADVWVFFYAGFAFLYRSFMNSKEGRWFPAYRDAVRGVNRLEYVIEKDSTVYDALLGIGSFKYWKSVRAKYLLWLPIIKDEKAMGISLIKKAIKNGIFVHLIAKDQLCWILMDNGQTENAFSIAWDNYQNFPQSRFLRWTLVEITSRLGKLELAKKLYQDLLVEIRQLPENNHVNELECLVRLAEIEAHKNRWNLTYQYSDEALKLKIDPDIRQRVKAKLKRALELRNFATKFNR